MRIVHLSTADCQGGAARAAFRLHEGLLRRSEASSMLVKAKHSARDSVTAVPADPDREFLRRLLQRHAFDSRRSDVSNTFFSLGEFGYDVARHPLVRQADVLQLHWVAEFQTPATIARLQRLGKPLVWTLHDQRAFTGGCHYAGGCRGYELGCARCPQLREDPAGLVAANQLDAAALCDPRRVTVVCPSRWLAEAARRSVVFRRARVEVIPYGLDTDAFAPMARAEARDQLGLPREGIYVLAGADYGSEKRKGFAQLREALAFCLAGAECRERVRTGRLRLLCFGGETGALADSDVPFTSLGYVRDDAALARVYAAADLFVLPSLEDNLPNTALEALSCGTPVLAFDAGGVPEVVADGVSGRLVPAGDARALGEALRAMVAEPAGLETLGRNGRRAIEKRHTLARQADRYTELYGELRAARRWAPSFNFHARETGPAFARVFPALTRAALDPLHWQTLGDPALTADARGQRLAVIRRAQKAAARLSPDRFARSRELRALRLELEPPAGPPAAHPVSRPERRGWFAEVWGMARTALGRSQKPKFNVADSP